MKRLLLLVTRDGFVCLPIHNLSSVYVSNFCAQQRLSLSGLLVCTYPIRPQLDDSTIMQPSTGGDGPIRERKNRISRQQHMAGPTGTFAPPLDTPPVIKYNAKYIVALVYWGMSMSVRLFVFLQSRVVVMRMRIICMEE